MDGSNTLGFVLADIVVVALTAGVLLCLALAMWLIVIFATTAVRRLRPPRKR